MESPKHKNRLLFLRSCIKRSFLKRKVLPNESSQTRKNIEDNWIVSKICRGCGKNISAGDFSIWNTYWLGMWAASHTKCRTRMKDESYECQKIDADCNDCGYFERGKMIQGGVSSIWSGLCKKFEKPTRAYPNFSTGHDCFVHRKDFGLTQTP